MADETDERTVDLADKLETTHLETNEAEEMNEAGASRCAARSRWRCLLHHAEQFHTTSDHSTARHRDDEEHIESSVSKMSDAARQGLPSPALLDPALKHALLELENRATGAEILAKCIMLAQFRTILMLFLWVPPMLRSISQGLAALLLLCCAVLEVERQVTAFLADTSLASLDFAPSTSNYEVCAYLVHPCPGAASRCRVLPCLPLPLILACTTSAPARAHMRC